MFFKGSRYGKAKLFEGDVAFLGIRPRTIGPAPGVIEHTVRSGDRLDHLAGHYYDDDHLWWRIADANPTFMHPGEMVDAGTVGKTILIPKAKE